MPRRETGSRRGEAAGPEAVIRTGALTKKYGDLVAVDRLNLEVRAGEIFGIGGLVVDLVNGAEIRARAGIGASGASLHSRSICSRKR